VQGTTKKEVDREATIHQEQNVRRHHNKSSGPSKYVILVPPSKKDYPRLICSFLRPQVYTIFGVDLTKFVTEDKQYAGMAPMERFLRDGGSSLQRKVTRPVLKALL
jgi:hypothetical protein